MPAPPPDVYAVLQADPATSWPELRRRYRHRALELHPDVQTVRPPEDRLAVARANRLFAELQAAWALVSTPERRAAYDRARRGRGPKPGPQLRAAPRPAKAPAPRPWPASFPVGVVEHSAPGGLHIRVPGHPEELDLPAFDALVRRHPFAVLIGEVPAHAELRRALLPIRFVERLRLTTMVGLAEPAEPREPSAEEEGPWKLEQVRRAFARWAAAFPSRRDALPYADDLRLMAQLSLTGHLLNPPHPAGLYAAVEPPPDRAERAVRRDQPLIAIEVPCPALLLVAAWTKDLGLQAGLALGAQGLARAAGLDAAQVAVVLRQLQRGRPRLDGQTPVPNAALAFGPQPPALRRLLLPFPSARAYLEARPRPALLPWGDPLAGCGTDRDLGDASCRLVARVLAAVDGAVGGVRPAMVRGSRLTFRVLAGDPRAAAAAIGKVAAESLVTLLGFPVGMAEPAAARPAGPAVPPDPALGPPPAG